MIKIIKVAGRDHVVCSPSFVRITKSQLANYEGTGMALCGVLKRGETLDSWKQRTNRR